MQGFKLKKTVLVLATFIFIVTMISLFIFYGPTFLSYHDKPVKSDAIILFWGDDEREPEALRLLNEGKARYLIIPALGEIWLHKLDGSRKLVSPNIKNGDLTFKLHKDICYKRHYEKTHIEVLEGKRIMADLGLHSVMLFSSPYHMRRIHLIADREFYDGEYTICCVPTTSERSFTAHDWFHKKSRDVIISEYVKIGWFLLYAI